MGIAGLNPAAMPIGPAPRPLNRPRFSLPAPDPSTLSETEPRMFARIFNAWLVRESQKPRPKTRSATPQDGHFERLDPRALLAAAIHYDAATDLVSIYGTYAADNATIAYDGAGRLKCVSWDANSSNQKIISDPVAEIRFFGGEGNDWVRNDTALRLNAYGQGGNDQLIGGFGLDLLDGGPGHDAFWGREGGDQLFGGQGDDQLIAGNGNDWIDGGDGADRLWGEAGLDTLLGGNGSDLLQGGDHNDRLLGNAGDDTLWGGTGDDQLNGGLGNDYLLGQEGNDTLVTLDNSFSDTADSGSGYDVLWINSSSASDSLVGTTAADRVHRIAYFNNSADLTLDGDRIVDPASSGYGYQTFSGLKLFASSGPSIHDIRQGQTGDCYFLAGLGSIASKNPYAIQSNIVDFNDGTFGVRLGNRYYRVDNDLAVFSANSPAFAKLGLENSGWVAIYEKAFAHHRTGQNSYASLNGGWSVETFAAFGMNHGQAQTGAYGNAVNLANQLYQAFQAGTSLAVTSLASLNNHPLVGNHVYMVSGFYRSGTGAVTHIVLRNPWGVDGGNNRDGLNDGYVVLTLSELYAWTRMIEWGR